MAYIRKESSKVVEICSCPQIGREEDFEFEEGTVEELSAVYFPEDE